MKTDKRADRRDEAAQFRASGHTIYAFTGQVTNVRDFGGKPDIAADIEAIEAGGWRLDHAAWSGIGVLLIFRVA